MRDAPGDMLTQLAISPTGFVFDPRTGATFTLNTTGRLILEGIRDGKTLAGLVTALHAQFDTSRADVERDVLEYVRLLHQQELLPRGFELE